MEASQFEAVYRAYWPAITNYLYRQTSDHDLANDLTGDTFERAFRAWPHFDGTHPKPWLYRIAVNVLIDQKRRARVLHFQALESPLAFGGATDNGKGMRATIVQYTARENTEGEAITHEALSEWATAIDRLPTRYRTALLLRQDGWNCRQIAEAMDLTYYGVKALLWRARAHLRAALPPDWDQAA